MPAITTSTPAPTWRDVSSYERGERGSVEPWAWSIDLADGVRVTVHRWRGLGGWYVTCHALKVDTEAMKATTPAAARKEAMMVLRKRARQVLAALSVSPQEPR